MNKIDKLINEMGRELLPHLTSKEDLALVRKMKKLHKNDPMEFEKKLKEINLRRRAEGLRNLHKNEILSKTLKKDIKANKVVKPKGPITFVDGRTALTINSQDIFSVVNKGKDFILPIKIFGEEKKIIFFGDKEGLNFRADFDGTVKKRIEDQVAELRFPEYKKKMVFSINTDFWGAKTRIWIEKL